MISLSDTEDSLSLFAEGIAGYYLHIKSTDEFANPRQLDWQREQATQTSDALLLPEALDAPDLSAYRVLAMQQIGLRECGTFTFRMQQALDQVPGLQSRFTPPKGMSARTGDFQLLFGCFAHHSLAAELFQLLELLRVQTYLQAAYPGLNKHRQRYHQHLLSQAAATDPLQAVQQFVWGDELACAAWPGLGDALATHQQQAGSVYDSVSKLCELYDDIAVHYVLPDESYQPQAESLTDWLNREQRIDEWQQEFDKLTETVMAVEMLQAEDMEAERGESDAGAVREADVDLSVLKDERDTLKRRIEMERSSVQHALGQTRNDARSYRYDEWDYQQHRYLKHWCRVYEERLIADHDHPIEALKQVIRAYQPLVQKQLEQIRPSGLVRVRRQADGDELDLNAVLQARHDIRAGQSPDERVYTRKARTQRDVGAVFLVDLSASTDDPVEPPEPPDWSNYDEQASLNLRDPWDLDLQEDPNDEPVRKIIDVQRDAMVVMASALDALGDSYAIYGFSGYGKDCVEIFVAKEAQQPFSQATLEAIAAMSPKRSTRMGPAIRHSTHKLMDAGHARKVLIVISDGFPQDCDYGPDRGDHEYGLQDTAKALTEAHQKGVETFCITVDRSGHDYLRRMCPDARYLVIEEMEDLPDQLTKVYTTLTGR